MALILKDRVKETCAAPGTGTVTLLGAVTEYQSFSAIGNGNNTYYTIIDQGGTNWEVGIGTYTASGTTLSRDTVLASSAAGAKVDFATGTQFVWCDYPAGKSVNLDGSGYYDGGGNSYLDLAPMTAPAHQEGRMFYDTDAKTVNYYNDNNQMSVNIGQEQILRVRNMTGADIINGTVVYVNGASTKTPTIAKAIATAFNTSDIIGVTTTDINNNAFGYVTILGIVNGIDTTAGAAGSAVFLSATTAGAFTTTEPVAPNYSVQVGIILYSDATTGKLLVQTQQISTEVSHIVGTVQVAQGGTGQTSYTNGQLLIGNTTGNTLTKSTLTAGTGVSITNGTGSITIANTGVTSVTGTSPVVSSGGTTPAISMAAANGSTNGYLTSTDWTTFNSKGSGTVTSVGTTGSVNGITLTGGPITGSGTVTLGGTLSNVSLTTQVTGTLPAANGGTGLTSPGTSGNILTSNGSAWTSSAPTGVTKAQAIAYAMTLGF